MRTKTKQIVKRINQEVRLKNRDWSDTIQKEFDMSRQAVHQLAKRYIHNEKARPRAHATPERTPMRTRRICASIKREFAKGTRDWAAVVAREHDLSAVRINQIANEHLPEEFKANKEQGLFIRYKKLIRMNNSGRLSIKELAEHFETTPAVISSRLTQLRGHYGEEAVKPRK